MDANEFLRKVSPASKRSCVSPYWHDIVMLRDSNCTLGQVCEFLKENGVQISIAGLSKYIRRREEKEEKGGTRKTAIRTETQTAISPKAKPFGETGSIETSQITNSTSSNPLRALSGNREPGEFNPIPLAKIEFD